MAPKAARLLPSRQTDDSGQCRRHRPPQARQGLFATGDFLQLEAGKNILGQDETKRIADFFNWTKSA
jgi:hypothetical protein